MRIWPQQSMVSFRRPNLCETCNKGLQRVLPEDRWIRLLTPRNQSLWERLNSKQVRSRSLLASKFLRVSCSRQIGWRCIILLIDELLRLLECLYLKLCSSSQGPVNQNHQLQLLVSHADGSELKVMPELNEDLSLWCDCKEGLALGEQYSICL